MQYFTLDFINYYAVQGIFDSVCAEYSEWLGE